MIKFIATDMDGTLVNDEGRINEKIFDLVHFLHEKDIKFAAASGRYYSQLDKNFAKIKEDMILIAHNGALVKYNKKGKVLYSSTISKEDIDHVARLEPKTGAVLFLGAENNAYIVNPSEYMLNTFASFDLPVEVVKDFRKVKSPIYKMTYHMPNGINSEMIEYLKKNLNDNLEFVVSADKWLDIMNKGTSKGNAVQILQNKFNIDEKNTMVFGDYYNDLSMFKIAHYSYAMKNAPEDVKERANFIADSNNNDGVYKVIHKYAADL